MRLPIKGRGSHKGLRCISHHSRALLELIRVRVGSGTGIIGAVAGSDIRGRELGRHGTNRNLSRAGGLGRGQPPAGEPGRPLPPALLYRRCDPAELPFDQSGEIEDLLGADRPAACGRGASSSPSRCAARATTSMPRRQRHRQAYHGRGSAAAPAAGEPTPPDWCYVNNFDDPQKPRRLQLPPGRARRACARR